MSKPSSTNQDDAFDVVETLKINVTISTGKLEIRPIMVKELPAFTRAIEPFVQNIMASGNDDDIDVLGMVMGPNAEKAIDAIAIGARISREVMDALDLDDLVVLAGAVIEVNFDFFIRRVFPRMSRLTEALMARVAGANSSLALSPEASASKK